MQGTVRSPCRTFLLCRTLGPTAELPQIAGVNGRPNRRRPRLIDDPDPEGPIDGNRHREPHRVQQTGKDEMGQEREPDELFELQTLTEHLSRPLISALPWFAHPCPPLTHQYRCYNSPQQPSLSRDEEVTTDGGSSAANHPDPFPAER